MKEQVVLLRISGHLQAACNASHQSWQTLLHCVIWDDHQAQVVTLSCRQTMNQTRRACLIWMLRSSQLLRLQSSLKQAARTKCHARQTCMVHHSSW